jgi:hypothetical protein
MRRIVVLATVVADLAVIEVNTFGGLDLNRFEFWRASAGLVVTF